MAKKKLILKIGTSTLTAGTDRISYAKIEDVARQIVQLKEDFDVVIVSSGAIATARQFVQINGGDLNVDSKQALAAIGQPKLMALYGEVFESFGLKAAQCLLVYRDFERDTAKENVKNTIDKLLEFGYTPIINENDTVAIDEIVLGDNDKLSAYVAVICNAHLLILASDVDGLFDHNPNQHSDARLIPEVNDLDEVLSYIEDTETELGTGGMTTKIQAAKICMENDIEMWIVNGSKNNFLIGALQKTIPLTRFIRKGVVV